MYTGQHLFIEKASGVYTHHALGLGNGRVIHYSGLADNITDVGVIEEVSLEEFAAGREINIRPHIDRKFTPEQAIIRAGLRLGEAQYHVLYNNCEHFVEWCISGLHKSNQSTRAKLIYSAGMGARALWGSKNPMGFLAGAAAGYAYIYHQGQSKIPDFERLEDEYERLMGVKDTIFS